MLTGAVRACFVFFFFSLCKCCCCCCKYMQWLQGFFLAYMFWFWPQGRIDCMIKMISNQIRQNVPPYFEAGEVLCYAASLTNALLKLCFCVLLLLLLCCTPQPQQLMLWAHCCRYDSITHDWEPCLVFYRSSSLHDKGSGRFISITHTAFPLFFLQ